MSIYAEYPESLAEAAKLIYSARAAHKVVIPAGRLNRLQDWPKVSETDGSLISTKNFNKIISIEPENLLAIVESGLTPAELRLSLEAANLYWPVSGQDNRSLGAIMAEGAVSLETMASGPMTDWVLGLTFIEPSGRVISSGGRTLKNVSGYDLTRLQWKAWGTLGLSAVFVLKCLPRPEVSEVLELFLPDGQKAAQAAETIIRSKIFPQGLHLVFKENRWSALIWFSGFQEYVETQIKSTRDFAGATESKIHKNAINFWNKRQEDWPLRAEGADSWRGSRSRLLKLAGDLSGLNPADAIPEADIDLGGGRVSLRLAQDISGKAAKLIASGLTPQAPALQGEIYRRVKKSLDPEDLFFPADYFKTIQAVASSPAPGPAAFTLT